MIQRAFPNIISADLPAAKAWFCDLVDFETEFDSDWFVHLRAAQAPGVELGIMAADHEIAAGLGDQVAGVMLTFVVPDVDAAHQRAQGLGYEVIEAPRDLFYGQRRMLLRGPGAITVDLSSECAPSPEFLAGL